MIAKGRPQRLLHADRVRSPSLQRDDCGLMGVGPGTLPIFLLHNFVEAERLHLPPAGTGLLLMVLPPEAKPRCERLVLRQGQVPVAREALLTEGQRAIREAAVRPPGHRRRAYGPGPAP